MMKSNSHMATEFLLDRKPDMSSQIAHNSSYNVALTRERDLARYRTAYSSKTNIFDQSRVVAPSTYFGTRLITPINNTVRYSPAGMDMVNSTAMTGMSFNKPIKQTLPQKCTFIKG